MAEMVVSPLIDMLVETVMAKLMEEGQMVLHVGDDVKTLSKTLENIRRLLADAEERQITERSVQGWLRDLKDIAYDADDVLDELQYEVFRQLAKRDETNRGKAEQVCNFFVSYFCFLPKQVFFRLDAAKRIKSINERLAKVSGDRKKFNLKSDDGNWRAIKYDIERPHTTSVPTENESGFVGRDKDKEEIKKRLLSDDTCHGQQAYSVISIVGMGGLGKTTLAQHAYNDERVEKHFEVRAWVCVSEEFDISRLTREIIESATKNKCELTSPDALQRELVGILTAKTFLIVLDDVWNEERCRWDSLRAPFKVGAKGSKIVVTTRTEAVSRAMCTNHPYFMEPLAKEVCVSLLLQHAFAGERDCAPRQLMEIGEQLAERHCQGLPLAAKVLGGLLYGRKELRFWESILNSQIWISSDNENEVNEVMKALRVSYHHLLPHIKQCFAFCSIFPKDYVFRKDELIRLWMAQGFILPTKSMTESTPLEEIGSRYFDHLLQTSFFQSYVISGAYKMHDFIHDLAISVSSEECLRMEHDTTNLTPNDRVRHLSLLEAHTDKREENLEAFNQCKRLRTIRCVREFSNSSAAPPKMTCQQAINNWIRNFECLRVLILKYSNIDELPDSISNLKHLRYLDVSCTYIKQLPKSASSLHHLQTLNLCNCKNFYLLPEKIGKLKNLRSLNLSETAIEQLSESLISLHSLETLDLGGCKNLLSLPEETGKLKNLRTLHLSRTKIKQLPESVSSLNSLETLDLGVCKNLRSLPEEIGKLKNLRSLHLSKTKIEQLPESVSCLNNLETLNLGSCKNLHSLPEEIGKLKNLRSLHLSKTEIEQLPTSVSSLHSLETLHLWGCKNLCSLPKEIGKLKNLRSLHLSETEIEQLPESVSSLHNLKTLDLGGCKNLRSLPEEIGKLKNLRSLHLSETEIEQLPESVSSLHSLKTLNLGGCKNLRSLSEEIGKLKNLRSLDLSETEIEQLPESVSCLHSLETLDLLGCKNLRSLPEVIRKVKNLRSLDLSKTEIEQLPESGSSFHSLETLDLGGCKNPRSLPEEIGKLKNLRSLYLFETEIEQLPE